MSNDHHFQAWAAIESGSPLVVIGYRTRRAADTFLEELLEMRQEADALRTASIDEALAALDRTVILAPELKDERETLGVLEGRRDMLETRTRPILLTVQEGGKLVGLEDHPWLASLVRGAVVFPDDSFDIGEEERAFAGWAGFPPQQWLDRNPPVAEEDVTRANTRARAAFLVELSKRNVGVRK